MAIHLHERYASEIAEKFARESLIAGRLSDMYSFTGVKTVNITTPITVPMVDYVREGANRYGTPVEMQDVVQELTLTQDKSFSMTIDKGNNSDQSGVKEAGRMLALQIAEQAVPTMDKYCFAELVAQAGNIVAGEPLTKENICSRITQGTVCLDDAEVPVEDRTLYVPADVYAMLRSSEEFQRCNSLLEKSLAKGQVGTYDGMVVIKVPSSRWVKGINFLIVHKSAACAPVKLSDTKLHQDPPGISGALLEGRQYYDLFVFGARCEGVYADSDPSMISKCAEPFYDSITGAFLCDTTSADIKYTLDGSDPRYSKTAQSGMMAGIQSPGTVVRAYATKAGMLPSDVSYDTVD